MMQYANEVENVVADECISDGVYKGVDDVVDITSFYDRQHSWLIFQPGNERERE